MAARVRTCMHAAVLWDRMGYCTPVVDQLVLDCWPSSHVWGVYAVIAYTKHQGLAHSARTRISLGL